MEINWRNVACVTPLVLGIVALGGCSSSSSLPTSVRGRLPLNRTVIANSCSVDSTGTHATASGTFANTVTEKTEENYPNSILPELRLSVVDVNGALVSAGSGRYRARAGDTSWSIDIPVRAGSAPTGCIIILTLYTVRKY